SGSPAAAATPSGPAAAPARPVRSREGSRRRANRVRAAAVAAGVVAATLVAVTYQGRSSHRDSPDAAADGPHAGGGSTSACDVRYLTRSDNSGTFAVDLTVTNTRDMPFDGWTLTFGFPADQRVVHSAGGRWTQSGRAVTVRPGAGQERLQPHAATVLTFAGTYHRGNPPPRTFSLDGTPCTVQV